MRFGLALLALLFTGGLVQAQDGYPNDCDPALGTACYTLGLYYLHGKPAPFPRDTNRAVKLNQANRDHVAKGCRAGNANECENWFRAIVLAPLPDQTAQDTNSALADLTRTIENLCLQGDAYACVQRGSSWGLDQFKWIDTANTVKQARYAELVAACASGDNVACGQGAILAIKLQLPQRKDAEPHYTMLAKACVGAEHSCDNLAFTLRSFARGDTQAKALVAQGIAALETACNMGNLPACGAHFHALPLRALNKQALLDKACISGHAESCAERATKAYSAYTRDLENIALLQSATEDFTTACALGHQIACHTLEHLSKG